MDLEQKIEMFSRRLAEDPHSRLFAPLADLLRQAGRCEDALELLDDGLGRHPEYVSALVIKGRTLLESGMMDSARSVLGQVLELDSENFVVLRLLTEDARSREAWDEAVPLLEKLVVLDPDDTRWNGALAEARKLLVPAASETPAAPDVPTGSSFATMTLVDIFLAQGYRDRALDALREMETREPGREDVRQRLREIEATPSGAVAPPSREVPPACPSDLSQRKSSQRSTEKKQFEEWISRIRQEGGS